MTAPQPFPPIGQLLERLGVWLRKGKSQHFLRRQQVCSDIADLLGAGPQDFAVEVGAGLGNLSVELAARAGRVVAVELDRSFDDWHGYLQTQYAGLRLHYADFLDVDLPALVQENAPAGGVFGVGNLPYQITSDILFKFVDAPMRFERLVFMIQKEVADRICAGPAVREAGALTYKIALRYRAHVGMVVPPQDFLPPPKVWSSVLVLEPLAVPLVDDPARRSRVYRVVDRVFQYRRKTLENGLLNGGLARDRATATAALQVAGIDPRRRPETLQLDEVLALEAALFAAGPE